LGSQFKHSNFEARGKEVVLTTFMVAGTARARARSCGGREGNREAV